MATSPSGQDDRSLSPVQSYLSPVSSEPASQPAEATQEEQGTSETPQLDSIATVPRKYSSDSDLVPIPPVHQFGAFPPNIYDSDGSDGSIVFNYPGTPVTPTHDAHQRPNNNHDRFPSFDSLTSTGSFQVTGSPQVSTHKMSPHVTKQTPVNLLPYAQRRKLMQQREQQQQEQDPHQRQPQRQGQMLMQPMPPNMYFQRQMPYPMDPNYPGAAAMDPGQYPPYAISGAPMMGVVPPQMGPPMQVMPPQQVVTKSRSKAPPGKLDTISSVPPRLPGDAKRKPQLHHSLPPSGQAPRGRTSSTDSLEQPPPRPQSRRIPEGVPPPPPPAQYHIRHDSSGSISSLGSTGSRGGGTLTDRLNNDISGYLDGHEQQVPDQRRNNGMFGFLHFSPSQRPQNMTAEEFHQRNQEFLQRSESERVRMQQAIRDNSPLRQQKLSPRHRPGLPSIDNDNWEEDEEETSVRRSQTSKHSRQHSADPYQQMFPSDNVMRDSQSREHDSRRSRRSHSSRRSGEASSDSVHSLSSDDSVSGLRYGQSYPDEEGANERTSLLPPPGISTHESGEVRHGYTDGSFSRDYRDRSSERSRRSRRSEHRESRPSRRSSQSHEQQMYGYPPYGYPYPQQSFDYDRDSTERWNNTEAHWREHGRAQFPQDHHRSSGRRSSRKSSRRHQNYIQEMSGSDQSSASASSSSYKRSRRRAKRLEKERAKLIAQWRAEALAQAEAERAEYEANMWYRRLGRYIDSKCAPMFAGLTKVWTNVETFISNVPLTIGAIALAIVTLGVVWFKFAEENLSSCEPVHFHSSQCSFPEFPGCFYCDKSVPMYKVAVNFHFTCSAIAGLLVFVIFAKVILATRVVLDEMSSPTTSSPAGLLCMTIVCVFAGRGPIGQCFVTGAAAVHLCLAIWFIYMALAYHIMPEPSWFPNTVGIGMSAVKSWLYYPMPGHLLMAISLSLNFFFFPISLIRVTLNQKMSAPVCWIQMSAPAVSLYALTIMAQPSFVEEHPDVTEYQKVHRMVYLPCMHCLFALACIGLISSVQSLIVRWDSFRKKAFSPAHAAFCFPTLAHANAIQSYRAAIDTFADVRPGSPAMILLYTYWVTVLVSGTLVTLWITTKFFYHLPSWVTIDVEDELEPPAPYETPLNLVDMVTSGDTMKQPFVSPAVLQANETGALVMLPSRGADGRRRFRRTRKLTALGFEPIMNALEVDHEQQVLLDYVAKHPPRRRTQTLSVPGIDFSYGDFGVGNSGVYGADPRHSRSRTDQLGSQRPRANTVDNAGSVPRYY